MSMRHQGSHIAEWQENGFTVVPGFLSMKEIAPVLADFEALYAHEGGEAELNVKQGDEIGRFSMHQFRHFDTLPYAASPAINLVSLHPDVIAFARALLGVEDVHLYQSHTWAKYTGEADYDQPFHCDFGNHTLVVPSDEAALRTVNFVLYITDVTDELGALHYVKKPDSDAVLGAGEVTALPEQQDALKARELSAAAPAGSLVAYGIDGFHRGTNLTEPGGRRFTMTFSYKAAGNDNIAFHTWQTGPERHWDRIMNHATPEQLACLGIPAPGSGYWTERTLRLTRARWPDMNLDPYVEAAGVTA